MSDEAEILRARVERLEELYRSTMKQLRDTQAERDRERSAWLRSAEYLREQREDARAVPVDALVAYVERALRELHIAEPITAKAIEADFRALMKERGR